MEIKFSDWFSKSKSQLGHRPFFGRSDSFFNWVQCYIDSTDHDFWSSNIDIMDWATDNKIPVDVKR